MNTNKLAQHPMGGEPLSHPYVWQTQLFTALYDVLSRADTQWAIETAALARAASATNAIIYRDNGVLVSRALSDTPGRQWAMRLEDVLTEFGIRTGAPEGTDEVLMRLADAYMTAIGL